jgi:isocitrate/isopropylmalate dehydrogenase
MRQVVELNGDGIAHELRDSVHAINEALGSPVAFAPVDWSVERRESDPTAVEEGCERVNQLGVALKYPTVTETLSPNKIMRERCGLAVIHRPCRSYPGVSRNYTGSLDMHVVRVATGGTYEDAGHRIGYHSAVSIRVMERTPCEHAAHFAFQLAGRSRKSVVSGSKYTIQRAADGLFEEVVDEVSVKYPGVERRRELFDALLAKLVLTPELFDVVVTPNEYGDFLSDAAYGLIGSIGLGASASYAFNADHLPVTGIFDPAGGTAPDIAGKGVANPTGAIEAFGYLLQYCGEERSGRALIEAVRSCIAAGEKTRDLAGTLTTREFTGAVIRRAIGKS